MLEYEIRRLEQLNLETAQRLKEPQTTDESDHEKEDFNLLSNDTESLMPRRISNLEDTSPRQPNPHKQDYTFEKADEEEVDFNSRVEEEKFSPSPLASHAPSLKSKGSRRLYVIEEEQSNLGANSNTFRSKPGSQRDEKAYITNESKLFIHRHSDTVNQ